MTNPSDREARLRELRPFVAAARQMQGWTFAYQPLVLDTPEPWIYQSLAHELAGPARRVVDLGTGGGEVYARILADQQCWAVATEGWGPNAAIASLRLGPAGVPVVHALSLALPFAAESFDLVLDRHEELNPAEVARVLRPGGRVLTQQVHPDYHAELRAFFPRMTIFEPHDVTYPRGFAAAGMHLIDLRHHSRRVVYRQLGHLVYFLVAAPWTIPDFDVEADLEALLAVEKQLGGPDGIVLTDPRYLLEARKPA